MEVTKNVIEDLLPMYLAGEVSKDTYTLVNEYLKTDPELAGKLNQLKNDFSKKVDLPFKKEEQLEAFVKLRRIQFIRTISLAVIFSGFFLALLAAAMILINK